MNTVIRDDWNNLIKDKQIVFDLDEVSIINKNKRELYDYVSEIYINNNTETMSLTHLDGLLYDHLRVPMNTVIFSFILACVSLSYEIVNKALTNQKFAPIYSIKEIWTVANDTTGIQSITYTLSDKDGFKVDIRFNVQLWSNLEKQDCLDPIRALLNSPDCITTIRVSCRGNVEAVKNDCGFDRDSYEYLVDALRKI